MAAARVVERARERLQGRHRHRLGRARLLRQVPQALHGRLGHAASSTSRRRAACCPAMRRSPSPASSSTTSAISRWAEIWLTGSAFQKYPRHRVDEGAVPHLPAARDRFRRLPLPGVRTDWRRGQHRSRLLVIAAARGVGQGGRCRSPTTRRRTSSIAVRAARRRSRLPRKRLSRATRSASRALELNPDRCPRGTAGAASCSVQVHKRLGKFTIAIR